MQNTLHGKTECTRDAKPQQSKCDCFLETLLLPKLHTYEKRGLSKNSCIRLLKNKRETSVNTYKTWRLKVKVCKCYIYL